ncbi:MAG: hypothetical protein RIT19_2781 [Verrucomicrobiota bacterium]|jgi:hypothetical protein
MKPLLLACWLGAGVLLGEDARLIKVLPHWVDHQGRHALSPSLYERDAYQAELRQHPEQRAGMQYEVLWKASRRVSGPLRLRLELRGAEGGVTETLETEVKRGFLGRRWSRVVVPPEQYRRLGNVTAWKATLVESGKPLAEARSFLW